MAYRLEKSESVEDGVKRVVSEEIHSATNHLRMDAAARRDEAVHEARKSIKKIRGVLRLMSPEMGRMYKRENSKFRKIARQLSDLRDAAALLEVFDQLSEKFKNVLDTEGLKSIRAALEQEKRELELRVDIPSLVGSVTAALDSAGKRLVKWPIAKGDFDSLAPGLKQTYKRGRRALQHAGKRETPIAFHDLRKRVKDHWYHLRLLEGVWTEAMQAHEKSLKELETWLGDDHNLVVLREKLESHPDEYGGADTVLRFMSVVAQHQSELQVNALSLGKYVYGEKPGVFVASLGDLWKAWHEQPDNLKPVPKSKVAAMPKPSGRASTKKARSQTA